MKILAIETSCDETGIALINADGKNGIQVLANLVRSQIELHRPYGGVVPNIAKRAHAKALPELWQELKAFLTRFSSTSDVSPSAINIDLVAVTQGPGLSPALWQGIEFGKKLSRELNVPLLGINHLKGHIYTAFLKPQISNFQFPISKPSADGKAPNVEEKAIIPEYPILALIVSGGHTELVLSGKLGGFKIIGQTKDDAAGEAFDKVARLLGLGYPGGPEISRIAEKGEPERFDLPRPMLDSSDFDFSFSGLKTAVTYLIKGIHPKGTPLNLKGEQTKADLAASFQKAVVDVLVSKTIRAAKTLDHTPKTIILGGGVAANKLLREELTSAVKKNVPDSLFLIPDPSLATDNALMIALAAWYERDLLKPQEDLEAKPNLKIDEK